MKTNPLFFYGLGEKTDDYKYFSKYMTIAKIDFNNCNYSPNNLKTDIAIGFSLGCDLACMYSEKRKVKQLILCSLTPCENLGKIRADEVIFFAGSKETFVIEQINRIIINLPKNIKTSFYIIDGVGHKMTKTYKNKVLEFLKGLN